MDRVPAVVPMTDRRLLIAVIGILTAALGVAMVLLALLALRHPVGATGEIGAPTDFGFLLTDMLWLGGVLAVAGSGTAVALVRAQLRARATTR